MRGPMYPKMPSTLGQTAVVPQSTRPPAEMSVSEATRRAKEALAQPEIRAILMGEGRRVPVTGAYYDDIRARQQVGTSAPRSLTNQFARGEFNKRGGVKSFAASRYNYPSRQMVIGSTLAGMHESLSPSEAYAAQRSRLMGLGAVSQEQRLAEFKKFIDNGIFKLIDVAVDTVNKGSELLVTGINAALANESLRSLVPAKIIAAYPNGLPTPIFDKNVIYAQLANDVHRSKVNVARTALQASLGDGAASIFDVINALAAIGLGDVAAKINAYITLDMPELARRAWITHLYKLAWSKEPAPAVLDQLLADAGLAAQATFAKAVEYLSNPRFDPAKQPAGGAGGAGGAAGGRGGKGRGRRPGPFLPPGQLARLRKLAEERKRQEAMTPPKEEVKESNTGLYIGLGVAAVAAIILLRRK